MSSILLKNEYNVVVDDEDEHYLKLYNWYISKSQKRGYVRAKLKENGEKKTVFLQHLVCGKPPKGMVLHFKDKNPLNCSKSNIEFITQSALSHLSYKLKGINKNCNVPFKGVIVQYIAKIKFKNKLITIGYFKNEYQAALAYNKKAIELFGDKAVLNNLSEYQ